MSRSCSGPGFISGMAFNKPLVLSSIATPVAAIRSSARSTWGLIRGKYHADGRSFLIRSG